MVQRAQDVDTYPSPIARNSEGTLFVDIVGLCQLLGVDPENFRLRLLIWLALAEYFEESFGEESRINYLPASMIPYFLETLQADAVRAGTLQQLHFYQHLFRHINELAGISAQTSGMFWGAETLTRLHRYILRRIVKERKRRKQSDLEPRSPRTKKFAEEIGK